MKVRSRRRGERGGYTILELTVSAGLLVMALVAVAQLTHVAAAQRHAAWQRQVAMQEAANTMERLAQWSWEGTTAERAAGQSPSPQAARLLANIQLQVDVIDEPDEPAKRIEIRVDWSRPGGQRQRPVRLVAWKYRTSSAAEENGAETDTSGADSATNPENVP